MKIAQLLFLSCAMFLSSSVQHVALASPAGENIVTAEQVNGTWRSKTDTFKVWALGQQKLQVEFFGLYESGRAAQSGPNIGMASGVARIEEDTAIFQPDDSGADCKIIMNFRARQLVVAQEGECGFGYNVTASGTYKKVSSQKPNFGEWDL